MTDWKKVNDDTISGIQKISSLIPETVSAYRLASSANRDVGHLGIKIRELISIAVAVTTRCDGCIAVHAAKARHAGASREEIAEAVGVAVAMNAGAALAYSLRALEATAQSD